MKAQESAAPSKWLTEAGMNVVGKVCFWEGVWNGSGPHSLVSGGGRAKISTGGSVVCLMGMCMCTEYITWVLACDSAGGGILRRWGWLPRQEPGRPLESPSRQYLVYISGSLLVFMEY